MRHPRIRTTWARRIMKAKHFVVLTDKESIIYFRGLDPKNFDDVLMLSAQKAELNDFRHRLDKLIKDHEEAEEVLFQKQITQRPF